MLTKLKQNILLNAKNIIGWKTDRRIIVISVDDYGNVRLDSQQAREKLDKAGLKVLSRFDAFDTLENKQDLEQLYDVLSSVKDKNGKHAVFTPFALPCNINFEEMANDNYSQYVYELLPETYKKLALKDATAYRGTWQLWQEGIRSGIMVPQFHGREHFNVRVFKEKLLKKDVELLTALKNRSYTSISSTGYSTISATAAFEFDKFEENAQFEEVIKTGLDAFEKVFGYRSVYFNSPGGREHPAIHKYLLNSGIQYMDTPWVKSEHQGSGKYKRVINYTGKKNKLGQTYLVRNVVFEPTHFRGVDWVAYTMKQIEAAFRWNRPVIISSHRVNFCGHIHPKNREEGLIALKALLNTIVKKWPDVEFLSASELGNIINSSSK
ncbi:MAG: hypothetical protein IPL48_02760 [Bacteroidetes bacterium]|nr:hypothetical protein [Bacteroidota bacterium]